MKEAVIILTQIFMNLNRKIRFPLIWLKAETVDGPAEAADNEIQKAQEIKRLSKSCPPYFGLPLSDKIYDCA